MYTLCKENRDDHNNVTITASVEDGGFWLYSGFVSVSRFIALGVVLLLSDYAVMKQWVSLCCELSRTLWSRWSDTGLAR